MDEVQVAVIGAGSVRCSPAVLLSLATYYGERALNVRLFDSDLERLDLFERFGRICFLTAKSSHEITCTDDPEEAIDGVDAVILQVGENCARKFLKAKGVPADAREQEDTVIDRALAGLLGGISEVSDVLSLQHAGVHVPCQRFYRLDWPAEPTEPERRAVPHQVLRFIRGEEYLHGLLEEYEHSPIKSWLENRSGAELVLRSGG